MTPVRHGTQAQTSTGRRANTRNSTQAPKCKQAGRALLAKSISGLVFQYRQASKRDPQRRRNTTQPFRSTRLRYRRTPYSDLVHRARPVCEKFAISRKKESLQSGHHAEREGNLKTVRDVAVGRLRKGFSCDTIRRQVQTVCKCQNGICECRTTLFECEYRQALHTGGMMATLISLST
jgi:hypothetical protein